MNNAACSCDQMTVCFSAVIHVPPNERDSADDTSPTRFFPRPGLRSAGAQPATLWMFECLKRRSAALIPCQERETEADPQRSEQEPAFFGTFWRLISRSHFGPSHLLLAVIFRQSSPRWPVEGSGLTSCFGPEPPHRRVHVLIDRKHRRRYT